MDSSQITKYFLYTIGFILISGLFFRIILKKKNKLISLLPNISVSLGILGTFVGIYIGLLEFDVTDISKSIPKLLEGLKTAFATSIAGLVTSIILKFIFESKELQEESKNEVKEEDPIDLLKALVSGINSLEISSKEIEKSIVACFRSDEEYSIISQMKLIRQEISDTRREFIRSFDEFAEKMAEVNTDSLVKALEKVIADFTVLLNELVSESFKELSLAMVKLNEWQEKYKDHVDTSLEKIESLIVQLNASVEIMELSSQKLSKISENLDGIDSSVSGLSVSAEDIALHIENLKVQNETLRDSLNAINQVGVEAKKVIPNINENISNLTGKLDQTVTTFTAKIDESMKESIGFINSSINEIQNANKLHIGTIEQTLENINKGLEQELTLSLNTLAGSMAALSAKFVEDYMPLTERLRDVVRLSEKINAN